MNSNQHIDVEDLASLALLLLSTEETSETRRHLTGCAECTAEYNQIRSDLGTYAFATEIVEVPAGARDRFIARMSAANVDRSSSAVNFAAAATMPSLSSPAYGAAAPSTATAASAGPALVPAYAGARSSTARILPWIGWAAAAAAIIVAVGLRQDRDSLRAALQAADGQTAQLQSQLHASDRLLGTLTDPSAVKVSLTVPKAVALPSARATYQAKTGSLLMLASNLSPLPAQKVYELWIIPANGGAPLPAGTFSPDAHGSASLLVPSVHGAVVAKALGITIEPAGGSTTPTMPIVLAGAPS
jgi:hypothetical protein